MKGKKTGGRTKGTPNRDNPIRGYLLSHSIKYFQANPDNTDGISDFEYDLLKLDPVDRVQAEIRILRHHTSELKSIDMDLAVGTGPMPIDQLLADLVSTPPKKQ